MNTHLKCEITFHIFCLTQKMSQRGFTWQDMSPGLEGGTSASTVMNMFQLTSVLVHNDAGRDSILL